LNSIFRDILGYSELNVTETTSSLDIPEWDSVAQVKLVLAIEEEFGVKIPDSDLHPRKFDSVARMDDYVASRIA